MHPQTPLVRLWAKWSKPHITVPTYHPVLCHLIDVAMVMEVMWERCFPTAWKAHVAQQMELSEDTTKQWFLFFAGLHDLGKACPGFQTQLRDTNAVAHTLIDDWLNVAQLPHLRAKWVAHGMISDIALRRIFTEHFAFPPIVASTIATAIGGHHGVFFTPQFKRQQTPDDIGEARWQHVQRDLVLQLAVILDLPNTPPQQMPTAAALALAGAVSVADWIGSIDRFFPHFCTDATQPQGGFDAPAYRDRARQQAQNALTDLQWTGWAPPTDGAAFRDLFPDIAEPWPLQLAAIDLAPTLVGPGMVIVEGPMGEGKTELALYLSDWWNTTPGWGGLYVALPTMATSNAMFLRVRDYLQQRFPKESVNLQLLHSHATLNLDFQALRTAHEPQLLPTAIDTGNPTGIAGAVVAAEWFVSKKRGLLAPFGVGTIDQALLAALQVKHGFVRLFGLSTKVFLADEIHAYDLYMTTLFERLLEWLGALGTPVIMLSATLPARRRHELLSAYRRGAGWHEPEVSPIADYPRITWATSAGVQAVSVPPNMKREQQVSLQWCDERPEVVAPLLVHLLHDGGCAAIVCSTVPRAQAMYRTLAPFFPGLATDGLPLIDIFHAQYPYAQRDERERHVVQRFGKKPQHRPQKAVLIGTQVIEQSLDLDFDVLLTDLAPIDLLLQRLGRLHRHQQIQRPTLLRTPQVYLLMSPSSIDAVPTFEEGTQAIYAVHLLLRTWWMLQQRTELHIPADIEHLVEEVYAEMPCPATASAAVHDMWQSTARALHADLAHERDEAQNRHIREPGDDTDLALIIRDPREEDAPELHPQRQALTRLGDPTVTIICLTGTAMQPRLPDGTSVDLDHLPAHEDVIALLRCSMTISSSRLVHALLDQPVPKGWQASPLLYRSHPLCFADGGHLLPGQITVPFIDVSLNDTLGFVITYRQHH